ncbi:sensor histidine kinase [Mucilaginibacter corticis]|nr:HAMP domain-containing sensor histidine kinase [Mucilaginibacter corticis]
MSFFRKVSERVGGKREHFPLTVRIFHSVLVICMAALVYNIPLNFMVGLPAVAIASIVSLLLVISLYYFSRYRDATAPARVIFCLAGTGLFIANFFLNSGVDGPTGYFFILILVIIVAIMPVKQYPFWIISNLLVVFTLHYIQYLYPDWVPFTYHNKADRYLDMTSAYTTVVVIVLACFYIIRRRYDAERQQAQQTAARLQELDAEKNKLFSIISHDLRSPLSLIQNYLELLAEFDLSESERRDIKAQLLQSTRGTLDMVNNVLHWSTSQMSGAGIRKENLAIAQLLEPQIQLFRAIAARKQIELDGVFAESTMIYANADMLQLIIRNLLNNAIKFTSPGGNVRLSANCNTETCLLIVKDSGNGQPAGLSDAIFEFSSSTAKGTANESGVGLGLVLCREYTTLMGGRIWFTCAPESGTTFYVELPVNSLAS